MTDTIEDNCSANNDKNSAKKKSRQRTEKKRIQDRLAQRANRERTRERIASLEEALKSLKAGNEQSNISSLMRTIADLRENNNRLRSTIDKIHGAICQVPLIPEHEVDSSLEGWPMTSITETELAPASSIQGGTCKSIHEQTDIDDICPGVDTIILSQIPKDSLEDGTLDDEACEAFVATEDATENELLDPSVVAAPVVDAIGEHGGMKDFEFGLDNRLDVFDQTVFGRWNSLKPQLLDLPSPASKLTKGIVPDIEKWYVGNSAYFGALDSVKRQVKSAANMDLQVALKAVFWGWESVGTDAEHPVWEALREVDQRVFGIWTSKAQRIAMMYICQTLILYRENPTTENLSRVPDFLWPRPAQERIEHPVVIDFLIWPGMRDRMIFEYEKYRQTGLFSAAYVENFTFFWPYADHQIFFYEPQHDRYELSPVFLAYIYNYKNWTMKAEFFERCPEMKYDVPAFENTQLLGPDNLV